jgi:hypothetical protein
MNSSELAAQRSCVTCLGVLPRRNSSYYTYPVSRHGESHQSLATVLFSFSNRHRAISNSRATARGSYKLSMPSVSQGSQAPIPSTRAFNCSLEPPNCSLPPNRSRAPREVTSPWPARYRSIPTLCSFVSVL